MIKSLTELQQVLTTNGYEVVKQQSISVDSAEGAIYTPDDNTVAVLLVSRGCKQAVVTWNDDSYVQGLLITAVDKQFREEIAELFFDDTDKD